MLTRVMDPDKDLVRARLCFESKLLADAMSVEILTESHGITRT